MQGRIQDLHWEGDTLPSPFLSIPSHFSPLPFPPLSSPSVILPLLSFPFPMIQLGGLGERCKLPHAAGPGGARPTNDFLTNLKHKIKHLTTNILTGFLINQLSKVCINWSTLHSHWTDMWKTLTEGHIKLLLVIISEGVWTRNRLLKYSSEHVHSND